jgi:hypothetical protein
MLFLMNDVVLRLDTAEHAPPVRGLQFQNLTFQCVDRLGRELFAEQPLLQRVAEGRAQRLASLITLKQPSINGALFVSPGNGCGPDEVQSRFVSLGFEVMTWLLERQEEGRLNTLLADSQVWRRLAA